MTNWPDLEDALQGRLGWKRHGREYQGPCPVTGAGKNCAWFGPGSGPGGVRAGCRTCGESNGRLDSKAFLAHLRAVTGEPDTAEFPKFPGRRAKGAGPSQRFAGNREPATGAALVDALWRAGDPVDGTPGWTYLHGRGCWPGGPVAELRWLPAKGAAQIGLHPRLPRGAAGALLYRFSALREVGTAALQCEAVNEGGERVLFNSGAKRPSVTDSYFGCSARVFVARPGAVGVNLCEGPIDALALLHLAMLGAVDLAGAAVIGAAGVGGFRLAAVAGWPGPVTLWPDGDLPGRRAAAGLVPELITAGRRVRVRWDAAGEGRDLADWAIESALEREAIQHDG